MSQAEWMSAGAGGFGVHPVAVMVGFRSMGLRDAASMTNVSNATAYLAQHAILPMSKTEESSMQIARHGNPSSVLVLEWSIAAVVRSAFAVTIGTSGYVGIDASIQKAPTASTPSDRQAALGQLLHGPLGRTRIDKC
jgi:hypothetical protein